MGVMKTQPLKNEGAKIYTVDGGYVCQIAEHPRAEVLADFDNLTVHNDKTRLEAEKLEKMERRALDRYRLRMARQLVDCYNRVHHPEHN